MLKNAILTISLLLNCLIIYGSFNPVRPATNSDRMTCEQARSDLENKKAVSAYAAANGSSFSEVHSFLRNSDYSLRNVAIYEGKVGFVYTAESFYPTTCGFHLPAIGDGGIVRIETDLAVDPRVESVW